MQLNQVRKRENKKAMKKKNQTSGSGDMDDKDQEWDIKKIMKDIEFFSNCIFFYSFLYSHRFLKQFCSSVFAICCIIIILYVSTRKLCDDGL